MHTHFNYLHGFSWPNMHYVFSTNHTNICCKTADRITFPLAFSTTCYLHSSLKLTRIQLEDTYYYNLQKTHPSRNHNAANGLDWHTALSWIHLSICCVQNEMVRSVSGPRGDLTGFDRTLLLWQGKLCTSGASGDGTYVACLVYLVFTYMHILVRVCMCLFASYLHLCVSKHWPTFLWLGPRVVFLAVPLEMAN